MIIKNNSLGNPSTTLRSPSSEGRPSSEGSDDNSLTQAFGFVARTMTDAVDVIAPGLSGAVHPLFNNPVVNAVRRHVVPVLREAGRTALVLNTKGLFMDLDPMKAKAMDSLEKGDRVGAERIVAAMERYQTAEKKQWDALKALKELYPSSTTIPLQLDYSENNPLVKRWMQSYRPWEPKIDALRALPVVSVFHALENSSDSADRDMATHIRETMDSLIEPNYPPFESIDDLDRVTRDINDVFGSPHIDAFVRKVHEQRTKSWMADPSFRNRIEIQSGLEALGRLSALPEAATDEELKKTIARGEEGVAARIGKMLPQAGLAAFRMMGRLGEIKAMPALSDRIAAYRSFAATLDAEILKTAVATNLSAYRAMKPSVATSDRVLGGLASISGFHAADTTSGFDAMIHRYEQVQALLNDGKIEEARSEFVKIESAALNGELKANYEGSQTINAGAAVGVVVAAALGMEEVTAAVGPELAAALGAGAGKVATLGVGAMTFRALHNYFDSKLQNDPNLFYNANRSLLDNIGSFGLQSSKDFAMFLTLGAALGRFEKFADARELGTVSRVVGGFGTEVGALQGFTAVSNTIETGDLTASFRSTVFSGGSWLTQGATILGIKTVRGSAEPLKDALNEVSGLMGRLTSGMSEFVSDGAVPEAARGGNVGEATLIDDIFEDEIEEVGTIPPSFITSLIRSDIFTRRTLPAEELPADHVNMNVDIFESLGRQTMTITVENAADQSAARRAAIEQAEGVGLKVWGLKSETEEDGSAVLRFKIENPADGGTLIARVRIGEVEKAVSQAVPVSVLRATVTKDAGSSFFAAFMNHGWSDLPGGSPDFSIKPSETISSGASTYSSPVLEIPYDVENFQTVSSRVRGLLNDAGFGIESAGNVYETRWRTTDGQPMTIRFTGRQSPQELIAARRAQAPTTPQVASPIEEQPSTVAARRRVSR